MLRDRLRNGGSRHGRTRSANIRPREFEYAARIRRDDQPVSFNNYRARVHRIAFGGGDVIIPQVAPVFIEVREHPADRCPDILRDRINSNGSDDRFVIRPRREVIEIHFHGSGEIVRVPAVPAVRTAEALSGAHRASHSAATW